MNNDMRELVLCVEYLRMLCEHTEGRRRQDEARLRKGMGYAIDILEKHRKNIPDFKQPSYWVDIGERFP
jgi:hypothetical protein